MRVIWKYKLDIVDEVQARLMPAGAQVLHVAMQNSVPVLWCLVDPGAAQETRYFAVYGTGQAFCVTDNGHYLGSAADDYFVWHVYEIVEETDLKPEEATHQRWRQLAFDIEQDLAALKQIGTIWREQRDAAWEAVERLKQEEMPADE